MSLPVLAWFSLCSFGGCLLALWLGYDVAGQWVGSAIGAIGATSGYLWFRHWWALSEQAEIEATREQRERPR